MKQKSRKMKTLFEVVKGLFLVLTVFLGIFFLRGDILFSGSTFNIIKQFLVPGYLVFSGLIIFYIIGLIQEKSGTLEIDRMYTRHFIIGILIGIVLAVVYIFVS